MVENRQNVNNEVTVTVKSKPMKDKENDWKHTIIDKQFEIATSEYLNIYEMIQKINPKDIYQGVGKGGFGHDGTSCRIEFGSSNNSVAYKVWSPDYDTSNRKLDQFLVCCKQLISLGGLDPDEIL